jgi:WS/DGAT/MGAT family acyltransferase
MAAFFERLSAEDQSFLAVERPGAPMHLFAVQIFEASPLRTPEGGVDFAAFRRAIASVLHRIPRYRQRIVWAPLEGSAAWVDDDHFDLDYHLRHTALPRPGSAEQLERLCARILEQPLDRARPLWEMWLVEGLDGDRFALLSKVHHCMMDGVSGTALQLVILSTDPEQRPEEPRPWQPRAAPLALELLARSTFRVLAAPLRDLRELVRADGPLAALGERARAIGDLIRRGAAPAPVTPLNGPLSPHRRIGWSTFPLADVKETAHRLGCSLNDLALAMVAGAVRAYLIHCGSSPDDLDFRVSAPVSTRRGDDRRLGNQVSSWIVRLPLASADPLARVAEIHRETEALKASHQSLGVETLFALAEWAPRALLGLAARATSARPVNAIVTNVPGPAQPLYLLGARMLEFVPVVPLFGSVGLGVALFSYDGKLTFGFDADRDLVPDLETFVAAIEREFAALAGLAQARGAPAEARGSIRVA